MALLPSQSPMHALAKRESCKALPSHPSSQTAIHTVLLGSQSTWTSCPFSPQLPEQDCYQVTQCRQHHALANKDCKQALVRGDSRHA